MKKLSSLVLFILFTTTMCSTAPKGQTVSIETNYGTIKVVLYDDTPLHRDNFIKLAKENFYEDLTFHRVIKGFMIQAGDAKTALDSSARKLDTENVIKPEFRNPKYYHKTGALAAARWGDEENPEKLSDAFQFYIVGGKSIYKHDLNMIEKERFERLKQKIYQQLQATSMDTIKTMYKEGNRSAIAEYRAAILEKAEQDAEMLKMEILFTEEQKEVYSEIGGAPHLDGEYTVFGEVYEGLDVVRQIESVDTNANNKPLKPVIIQKISIIED